MIPLCVPNLAGNEARYLQECVDSTYVSSVGPFVDRFETFLAEAAGTPDAVAVTNGTAALHTALVVAGVGTGDLVIVPAFTFIATANAVRYCGADPLLLDISVDSWTLSPEALQGFVDDACDTGDDGLVHRASGRPVRAVVAVHTMGHPADLAPLQRICDHFGLSLVVDAAAALGATYRAGPALAQAELSAISFNGNKTVTCGGGGAVVGTNAQALAQARHLTTTGRVSSDYDYDIVGFNYRMTNLQAAVGCAQMERWSDLVAAKRRIASTYDKAFADQPGLLAFPEAEWAKSACWFSGFWIGDAAPITAQEAIAELNRRGIGARPFWKPVHLQPPYSDVIAGPLSVTHDVWHRIVTLPCSTGLRDDEQAAVIDTVVDLLGG